MGAPKVVTHGEVEDYKGMHGHVKKKADLFSGSGENKKLIGYAKAEPIMDADNKIVAWCWYVKGGKTGLHGTGKSNFFVSLRAACKAVEKSMKVYDADTAYEKSENFVGEIGASSMSSTDALKAALEPQTAEPASLEDALAPPKDDTAAA